MSCFIYREDKLILYEFRSASEEDADSISLIIKKMHA